MVQCPELCTRGAISLTKKRAVLRNEQLHREHADIIQRFGDAACDRGGIFDLRRRQRRRHGRAAQDVILMLVLRRVVGGEGAVAPARGDDRCLEGEIDEFFEDSRHRVQALECGGRIERRARDGLALAVIAHAPRS